MGLAASPELPSAGEVISGPSTKDSLSLSSSMEETDFLKSFKNDSLDCLLLSRNSSFASTRNLTTSLEIKRFSASGSDEGEMSREDCRRCDEAPGLVIGAPRWNCDGLSIAHGFFGFIGSGGLSTNGETI
tara:strand:+ start:166 stop:555 length:390 start_codon:yes stop_codon:yes gene_type:complete